MVVGIFVCQVTFSSCHPVWSTRLGEKNFVVYLLFCVTVSEAQRVHLVSSFQTSIFKSLKWLNSPGNYWNLSLTNSLTHLLTYLCLCVHNILWGIFTHLTFWQWKRIAGDWSFDEAVVRNYNCTVRAFDPRLLLKFCISTRFFSRESTIYVALKLFSSIGLQNHTRHVGRSKIYFYNLGIDGQNTIRKVGEQTWRLQKMSTIYFSLENHQPFLVKQSNIWGSMPNRSLCSGATSFFAEIFF